MFKITNTETLAPDIQRITVTAPKIAKKRKPGQFVILRLDEHGERFPLTIYDVDPDAGTITLVVQGIGKSTKQLNQMKAGESIRDVAGPLGIPSEIEKYGTVAVLGGGVGTAVAYPSAKALKDAGNYVISIVGCRSKDLVILEDEVASISDEPYVTTDDGSYGFHGFCTQKLQELIDNGTQIDLVLAVGPLPMMQAVAEVTRPYKIKTVVSLNPIMVDGTGMCGGCRATVGGKTVFVCVDGPEFDAHQVDFKELMNRNQSYKVSEEIANQTHECKLDKAVASSKEVPEATKA
jgi:ferredoxin--NADP+ reductase